MIRTIGLALSVVFIFILLGCGGGDKDYKPPINTNPDKKPAVAKPETPKEVQWLSDTFGKYFEGDGLKEFAGGLSTMSEEDFESTLRGLGTDDDKPSDEDIAKAMTFFKGWKEKEAEKAGEAEPESPE